MRRNRFILDPAGRKLSRASACIIVIFVAGSLQSAELDVGSETDWYHAPFRVAVNEEVLDTASERKSTGGQWFSEDMFGHAAPETTDFNADGAFDLIVSGFSGRFRIYENVGVDGDPRFADYTWIRAGDELAHLHNYCCMAATVKMADINGDEIIDLTAGSYLPGAIYWFMGIGPGVFDSRQMLTDWSGVPVFTRQKDIVDKPHRLFGAKPAWVDWDDDGLIDLFMGNAKGDLVVRKSKGPAWMDGVTAIDSQPVFVPAKSVGNDGEFQIFLESGDPPLPGEGYTAPEIVDWDGDGLWDLLVGVESGRVYFLRNQGEPGFPSFKAAEVLLDAGVVDQWVENDDIPMRRGWRSQVSAVDYNADGKLDLLVGDHSISIRPKADLDPESAKRFEELRAELDELLAEANYPYIFTYSKDHWPEFKEDPELLARTEDVEAELWQYLAPQSESSSTGWSKYQKQHGFIWVYLRK